MLKFSAVFSGLAAIILLPVSAMALEPGDKAPDFSLPALQNRAEAKELKLSDFKGKIVYLDFWASWCAPCKISLPLLDQLQKDYQSQGANFAVLAVNVDSDPEDGLDFLHEHPVAYSIVHDSSGATPKSYALTGMPTAFLIDAQGTIQVVHQGFKRSDISHIKQEIDLLLSGARP